MTGTKNGIIIGSEWLKDNSPENALIMARQPVRIYLYSGRSTVDLSNISSDVELEKSIAEQGIDYVLIAPELKW